MATTPDAFTYEVPIHSSFLSVFAVLIVDVLVLWVIHHSLHKIGALLALRQLLHDKRAVKISELWFENCTGRTHGPLWFRYTQTMLKMTVFVASIVLSLSLNGSSRPRIKQMTGQTILIQKPRTLQNLGLGSPKSQNLLNFPIELLFASSFRSCKDENQTTRRYYNARLTSPLKSTDKQASPQIDCLTERGGYVSLPLLTVERPSQEYLARNKRSCRPQLSKITSPRGYAFNITGCSTSELVSDCFKGKFATVCASFVTIRGVKWVYTEQSKNGIESRAEFKRVPPVRIGKDTLAVYLRYVEHAQDLQQVPVEDCMVMALYQSAPNSTVEVFRGGNELVTVVYGWLLWPALAIITVVLVGCCSLSLASMAVMMYTKCDVLDLGFSPEQVARLAAMDHRKRLERRAWYLQLHPLSQCITVSTNSTNKGQWTEEQVQNKYRIRE